jgi:hypothetical protein
MRPIRYRYVGGQLNRRTFTTTDVQPSHRHGDGQAIPDGTGYAVIHATLQLGFEPDVYCLNNTRREYIHISRLYAEMRALKADYDARKAAA